MAISRAKRFSKKRRRGSSSKYQQGFYQVINEDKYKQPQDRTMNKALLPEYRSSYELKAYKFFDINPDVEYWSVEAFSIKYLSPKDGRVHRYFPDVLVKFKNGEKYLIEIKPKNQTSDPVVVAKARAAKIFCENNDMKFIFLTEKELGIK